MSDPNLPPERFVFFDPHGRRWPRLRRVLVFWCALAALAAVLFLMAVWVRPAVRLPRAVRELKGALTAAAGSLDVQPVDPKSGNWQRYLAQSSAAQERLGKVHAGARKAALETRDIRLAFYADWDANALVSLHEHASELTHLAPEWFNVVGPEAQLVAEPDLALAKFCAAHGISVIPVLRNLSGDTWQPEAVENLARAPALDRARFIRELTAQLHEINAGGVLLDWNGIDPAYRDEYTRLFTELSDALHTAGRELWLAVSMDDELATFDLDAASESVDRFVALLFDEHGEGDEPGPLASQEWVDGWLQVIAAQAAPEQWIIALGSYASDWNTTRSEDEPISFRDAMSRASYAGVDREGGRAIVNAPNYNGRYAYSDPNGEHVVWFLDAISFHNQLAAVRAADFAHIGLSRLGMEDPAVWNVLARRTGADAAFARSLAKLGTDEAVTHVGRGEIVSVDVTRDDGERTTSLEPDGKLTATYIDFPTYPVLYHQGAGDKHAVALTFDDGPDPRWTPLILDVLKARGLKAAFFVVGRNAEDHPELVERLVREGHEIGNHTYTHGNLAEMSEWRMQLELDATERLIESITGFSTALFRPPYNADSTPGYLRELAPLHFAEKELGYTIVLEKIDPQDWARPGADVILQRVKDLRAQGNIILLHDAGGDRSQTLQALPRIIDWLTERGDRIVSLSELLKIPRDELMPPVESSTQPGVRAIAGTGFRLWHSLIEFLWAFMIFATGLVVLRAFIIAWLAWQHRCAERRPSAREQAAPPVSVIIAAFNEQKVIESALQSVLASDYRGAFEIVVVDDGSLDETAAIVAELAAREPRIRLWRQPNAGKAAALRRALGQAQHEFLVFLDADTLIEPQTITCLVQPMAADASVAGVSGQARVGNVRNFLTACQSLEYVCGFNLDRRAYTMLDCVTVVPGAISALRASAITAAGGFSHDTLAEDTDMTLMLHKLGYRISYAARAVAWTEAPETWRGLAKQRFRWAFGTMQCLWKHRDLLFNPRFRALGFLALPSIWFFQVILVAITPVADAILIYSLAVGYASQLWEYFALFLFIDLFLASLACALEREPLRKALLIIPMRLVYRWLLAWVIWRAVFRAAKGALVGWGKIERTASVPSRA